MTEWVEIFKQLGVVGLVLLWLTLKLIPQLQKERSEAIAAFVSESEHQRKECQENVREIMAVHQKALDQMIDHLKLDHANS